MFTLTVGGEVSGEEDGIHSEPPSGRASPSSNPGAAPDRSGGVGVVTYASDSLPPPRSSGRPRGSRAAPWLGSARGPAIRASLRSGNFSAVVRGPDDRGAW